MIILKVYIACKNKKMIVGQSIFLRYA